MHQRSLLERLAKGGAESDAAWKEFLRDYSNLFLKVIWQFEKDREKVMDTYLYVCIDFTPLPLMTQTKALCRCGRWCS